MRKAIRVLGGILFAAVLAGALLEVGARFWLHHFATEVQFRRYSTLDQYRQRFADRGEAGTPYIPHRYLGYVPAPNYDGPFRRINSLGFRGEEFPLEKAPGEFRIVCLGSSTTMSVYPAERELATGIVTIAENVRGGSAKILDDAARSRGMRDYEDMARNYSYPGFLQRELHRRGYTHVRVINAGAEGYTSFESLLNLELRCLDLSPDLVIVYEGYNDIHTRLVWPPRTYVGDNSGATGHSTGWYRPLPWFMRSVPLRIMSISTGKATSPVALDETFGSQPRSMRYFMYKSQVLRGIYPSGAFERVPVEQMLKANRPVFYRRNLMAILVLSRAFGARAVLVTMASRPDALPDFDTPEYREALAEHNAVLREVGSASGAATFDLASVFPRDSQFFTDIIHMTGEGGEIMARLIADFLVNEDLVPLAGLDTASPHADEGDAE